MQANTSYGVPADRDRPVDSGFELLTEGIAGNFRQGKWIRPSRDNHCTRRKPGSPCVHVLKL